MVRQGNMRRYYPLDYKPEGATPADAYLQYAEVYKDAITILLAEFSEHEPMHDYSMAPVLALLRQYIELQLKGIIMYHERPANHKPRKGHDIFDLYKLANRIVEERYRVQLEANEEVSQFIEDLGKLDPKGQIFRYPETLEGKDFDFSLMYEQIMSISRLKEIAEKVFGDLEGLEGYLDFQRENEEEAASNFWENYQ